LTDPCYWPDSKKIKGRRWKLCPWSQEYLDRWSYETPLGMVVLGNSLKYPSGAPIVGLHTTTSGGMVMDWRGAAGWTCTDPACPYLLLNNKTYFES